jgi:hypothetical protein
VLAKRAAQEDEDAPRVLALWARTSKGALDALARLEPDPFLVDELALAPGGRAVLEAWLTSDVARVRRQAALRLSEDASAGAPVWEVLIDALTETQHPFVVESALGALARAGPRAASARTAIKSLWGRTGSPEAQRFRPWAAWALQRVGEPQEELKSEVANGIRRLLREYADRPEDVSEDDFLHAIIGHPPTAREFLDELWGLLDLQPTDGYVVSLRVALLETLREGTPIGGVRALDVARRLGKEATSIRAQRSRLAGHEGKLSDRFALIRETGFDYEVVFNPRFANALLRALAAASRLPPEADNALTAYEGIADEAGRVLLARVRRQIALKRSESVPKGAPR